MRPVLRLDEARRQHYLKAMGIPMWYARATLPGAKPSPTFDFSGFEEAAEPQLRRPAKGGGESARPVQSAADLLKQVARDLAPNDPPLERAQPKRQAPAPVVPDDKPVPEVAAAEAVEPAIQADATTEEVPEFCVRAYQAGRYVMLNLEHPEIDAHREAALLANIAQACWGQPSEFLYELAWPVFSNPRLPGQELFVAQKVLKHSLKEYLDGKSGLILFGQPPLWLARPMGQIDQADQMLAIEAQLPVLATWSLGEMLIAPQRKRDVWLHLHRFSDAL